MVDFKQLAENILDDIMSNKSISDILLKTKIFAAKKNDVDLLEWVTHELEGYQDAPPKYRILNSYLIVYVHVPYSGISKIRFPTEIIQHEGIRERLSLMPFHDSISEIEAISSSNMDSSDVCMKVPVFAYDYMNPFVNGTINDSYQCVTKASVCQIVTVVKSLLIDFLLKFSNEENIDFNSFIKTKQIMIQTNNITAGIVNMGAGSVNAQGATTIVGDNNTIANDSKDELRSIIEAIDKIAMNAVDHKEYDAIASDIRIELANETPKKSFLKRCFQAIPTVLGSISSDVIANQLQPYIAQAIALLG